MMSMSQVAAFAVLTVVMVVVPGPSVLFTIGRALTVGRREALLTVVGNAVGVYLQVVAVAFGVGVLVERSAAVFTAVKLAGAGYLVFLGVQAIRHRRRVTEALAVRPVYSAGRSVRDGLVVGLLNPKSILFFAVALPQFVAPEAGAVPVQMLVLGALFPVTALVFDSVWALAAATARAWFARSPRRLELVGGTGGLMMIGLGAGLAVSGRRD
ncbi:lysine transporter LysE [Actinophytocola xanthii]|uniref:Lysine transporter LysE n=2 Tax=Actinophytocola xanthii TaxID=1912961 RepID=A0A1Q8CQV7_9PSEU|nr:LysE family translocator [Actinophytocola xanthii]OLF16733.1 lysine transporter LysE [Actinophytocola xanthii]